jgi:hypothetical protein
MGLQQLSHTGPGGQFSARARGGGGGRAAAPASSGAGGQVRGCDACRAGVQPSVIRNGEGAWSEAAVVALCWSCGGAGLGRGVNALPGASSDLCMAWRMTTRTSLYGPAAWRVTIALSQRIKQQGAGPRRLTRRPVGAFDTTGDVHQRCGWNGCPLSGRENHLTPPPPPPRTPRPAWQRVSGGEVRAQILAPTARPRAGATARGRAARGNENVIPVEIKAGANEVAAHSFNLSHAVLSSFRRRSTRTMIQRATFNNECVTDVRSMAHLSRWERKASPRGAGGLDPLRSGELAASSRIGRATEPASRSTSREEPQVLPAPRSHGAPRPS